MSSCKLQKTKQDKTNLTQKKKKSITAGHWRLMPVILDTWEAEIGRTVV
jgi:hypothetical protein